MSRTKGRRRFEPNQLRMENVTSDEDVIDRRIADFYATPKDAFDPLLEILPRECDYWEPACGDGRLVTWMRQGGLVAHGADLLPNPWKQADFLKDKTQRDVIITNPAYSLAQDFVDHALKHSRETYMLLRLNFLGSKKRKKWWATHKPSALFILSTRPDFTGGGGDACDYAWFVWSWRWHGLYHL